MGGNFISCQVLCSFQSLAVHLSSLLTSFFIFHLSILSILSIFILANISYTLPTILIHCCSSLFSSPLLFPFSSIVSPSSDVFLSFSLSFSQPQGFGFVTFKRTSEADRAKFEMDGAVVDGRVIEVGRERFVATEEF